MGRLALACERLIARFMPESLAEDRAGANRARMFLISHLFGPVLGNTVPLALFVFDPTPGWNTAVLAASISLFWVFPFLLRRGIAYERLVLLSVVNLNFAILWSCYHNGGVASPTLTWALIIPILSLFYLGGERRLQRQLLGITAGSFAIFLAAYILLQPTPNDIPETAMIGLGAVSTVATLAYVAFMAVYYARVFDAGVDLEIEVRRRRQMADELRRAIVHAHRIGSARAEFLARMSHEIRTPLNAIIGYGQILREEAEESGDELLLEDVDRILEAANYLMRLINMILDLAKIDAGRMLFDARTHDLRAIIEAALAPHRETLEEGGNRITIAIDSDLSTVEVDHARLVQILGCIIENAARHTRDGEVTIRAARAAEDGREPAFTVAVSDTGPGIEAEVMAGLFESFSARRRAADGRYGGTGLSLTLCAQLCRGMGGHIEAESMPGVGSTFTVHLPAAPPAAQDPGTPVMIQHAA